MLPNRSTTGQSSAIRKSRLEGKPSLIPKPRRLGSSDRLSTEANYPSTTGHRSSSAEPARGTFGARLSREASATKLPSNARSRSQTGEARYGQATTKLRSSHYSRPTTTLVRTLSENTNSRSWQTSLERALTFVTVKDERGVRQGVMTVVAVRLWMKIFLKLSRRKYKKIELNTLTKLRPLSSAAWQRSESARVSEALAARGVGAALLRPLTIARFVDVAGALLVAVSGNVRLSTDNYVTKLPHLSKRLLYPGTVSKSWLRTVNTLHAYPHALAFIAYLLDLVTHIEMPVLDEWLYVAKDEWACLRRDYLSKCWIRFQDSGYQFEDLNEDYVQRLKLLLGNDEEKIAELQSAIKYYESCLEDEAELAARKDEERRVARRDALQAALRAARAARIDTAAAVHAQRARRQDQLEAARQLDLEVERAGAELEHLRSELSSQSLSVAERDRLLDDVDYATRVHDSKRALAEHIAKMVTRKGTELALWQKKTLDSCVEYNQGLIHLSAQIPSLASLAVDENSLMGAECAERLGAAVAALRAEVNRLAAARTERARARFVQARRRELLLRETRAKIAEVKASIQREQQSLDAELAEETSEAAAWATEESEVSRRLEQLRALQEQYAATDKELAFWEDQDRQWRTKLDEMEQYIESQKIECARRLESARERRLKLVRDKLGLWNEKLGK